MPTPQQIARLLAKRGITPEARQAVATLAKAVGNGKPTPEEMAEQMRSLLTGTELIAMRKLVGDVLAVLSEIERTYPRKEPVGEAR